MMIIVLVILSLLWMFVVVQDLPDHMINNISVKCPHLLDHLTKHISMNVRNNPNYLTHSLLLIIMLVSSIITVCLVYDFIKRLRYSFKEIFSYMYVSNSYKL